MKTTQQIETELNMKERRVSYWETFGVIPTMNELLYCSNEDMEMGS